jgi:valyl-tRNA synthetase
MSNQQELEKTFSSKTVENKWYKTWEEGKYFKPRPGKTGKSYCIIMPPPNVTGRLHAGHALDIVTQDALIRFKRMKGFETLWLPGMDHAGIATQNVVEKLVYKEEKKTRHDFDKDEFVQKIWKWKEEYGGIIDQQQRCMGASPDWDYSMFTMDPEPNEAVRKVFTSLFNEGLIYQSDYIVNWDPVLQSAISDAEVEHDEVKGAFYHLHYSIRGSDEKVEIATTRPETLLGDTAICVHPEDERFKHLIGQHAIVPLCNREIPIIADDYVDQELGTGCLKVTPGHDFNDFEIGQRHKLPIINILRKDGTLNEYGLEWEGLNCKNARPKIAERLEELGILLDTKPHRHQVGHGDRSKAIIEPLVSKQWFLNVQGMADEACKMVDNDTTKFYPKQWENTYFSWLRKPKNWCISRQLWWGHKIPVFNCNDCHHQWADEALEPESCPKCQSKSHTQDPDVLDTWFSSALWPMSTLGWPNKERMEKRGFEKFYPTSVLVTGYDIIFFWVARMMMMGLKFTKVVPFNKVYIHAIVRDKFGRKMSKSLNNGIDPLEMVDQYGADAFRFSLAIGSGYNRGINLDPTRIEGFRNFINKIWNAFRFVHPFLDQAEKNLPSHEKLDPQERWILSELNSTSKIMNESIEEFRYDDSCNAIYSFVYDKFCSWFIELSKPVFYGDNEESKIQRATVLKYALKKIVALLHPFTPYITEELWTYLKDENEDLLIIQEYPEFSDELVFQKEQVDMNRFVEVISAIRNLRSSLNISPKEEVEVSIYTDVDGAFKYFEDHQVDFLKMGRLKKFNLHKKSGTRPQKSIMNATTHTEVFLSLEGVIDIDDQIQRLEKDLKKAEKEQEKYEKKLKNEKFLSKAPDEIVAEVKFNFEEMTEKVNSIKASLHNFRS